jgi:hypothetical protein
MSKTGSEKIADHKPRSATAVREKTKTKIALSGSAFAIHGRPSFRNSDNE